MSKRRKEIQKRKKIQEMSREKEAPGVDLPEEDAVSAAAVRPGADGDKAQGAADDSWKAAEQRWEKPRGTGKGAGSGVPADAVPKPGRSSSKEILLLMLLVLYVLVLGLGTAGELFEIKWILDLGLFK